MVTTLNLPDKEIKSIVESRRFLSELKKVIKAIDKGRVIACQDNELLLSRSGYDELYELGIWNAKALRQEYANCLCMASSLNARTRRYVIKLGNFVLVKTYNKKHKLNN